MQPQEAASRTCYKAPCGAYENVTQPLPCCAGVLRAVAQAGGAGLWASNGRPYEEAVALCVTFLDDPSCAAGDAAGAALGAFVAAAASFAAADAVGFALKLTTEP